MTMATDNCASPPAGCSSESKLPSFASLMGVDGYVDEAKSTFERQKGFV